MRHRGLWAGALALACALGVTELAWAQGRLRIPPDAQGLDVPRRAPLTLTPILRVEEEYNDNVLLNNDDQRWDLATRFTPGIALEWESAIHRLTAAYSVTADLYARESGLNRAFDRHDFFLDGLYRVAPRVTLALSDTFLYDRDTNLIAPEGVSVGRDQSFANTLGGSVAWVMEPRTTVRGGAAWSVQRFDSKDLFDSDVYRADVTLERALTTRLTGSLGYEFATFDIEREEHVTAHTARLGLAYRITETLRARILGGPTVEIPELGATRITPSVSASLRQRTGWGGSASTPVSSWAWPAASAALP